MDLSEGQALSPLLCLVVAAGAGSSHGSHHSKLLWAEASVFPFVPTWPEGAHRGPVSPFILLLHILPAPPPPQHPGQLRPREQDEQLSPAGVIQSAGPSLITPFTSLSLSLLTYKIRGSLPCLPCKEPAKAKTVEMGQYCEGTLVLWPGPELSGWVSQEAPRLCLMALEERIL